MNSRPVVRCQNINANVIQLDPEHQRCRTHYKETACVSSVKHEKARSRWTEGFIKKVKYSQYYDILHFNTH